MSENIDNDMKELLMKSCNNTSGKPAISMELTNDVYNYVIRQINDYSDTAVINFKEYSQMLSEAEWGLTCLVYIVHFTTDFEMVVYDPLYTSALNLLRLKFSEVRDGKKRAMKITEIQSKQPIAFAAQR